MKGYFAKLNIFQALLALLLIIAIASCCVAFCSVDNNAFAVTNSNIARSASEVGNILLEDYAERSDGKVFDAEAMAKLYEQITGTKGATLDTVGNKIDGADTYGDKRYLMQMIYVQLTAATI